MEFSNEKIEAQIKKYNKKAGKILSDSFKTRVFVNQIMEKVKDNKYIGSYFEHLRSMCGLLSDYTLLEYTEVDPNNAIMIASALVYLVSALDIVPDIMPFIGYLDDVAVLAYVISKIRVEIVKYNVWRNDKHGY